LIKPPANACAKYLNEKTGDTDEKVETNDEEEITPFVKKPDARKVGRYTPLHWASYKGHIKVVWILLKKGISPDINIDMYGNTAIHQAAAAGKLDVMKCFLAYGIDI